jgi:hypothetical protein
MDINVKLQKLLYLLCKTLPLLRHIQQEQSSELEAEASIRGIALRYNNHSVSLVLTRYFSLNARKCVSSSLS